MKGGLITDPILGLVWRRLQHISCAHAILIQRDRYQAKGKYHKDRFGRGVPESIEDNVQILGRGDEEEIKGRLFWYQTYYPELWGNAIEQVKVSD